MDKRKYGRIVIKVGSNSLASASGGINGVVMDSIAYVISKFREQGASCILVSSGAVASGMGRLSIDKKPNDISSKQALAAVGQGILIEKYSYFFAKYDQICAQILLSRIDLGEASHYKNAQNAIDKLLDMGVVPIINENDTVVVEELCFGDNDRLSSLVAGMVSADLLVLVTDVDGLYTVNPKRDSSATFIEKVEDIGSVKGLAEGSGSEVGTGGMVTKIKAAEMAANFGIPTFLTSFKNIADLSDLMTDNWPKGTYFSPVNTMLNGEKRWLAYGALTIGQIIVDDATVSKIENEGKSIILSSIVGIEGVWDCNDPIRITDSTGCEIARGLAEVGSANILSMMKDPSFASKEIVNFDNMTVLHGIGGVN